MEKKKKTFQMPHTYIIIFGVILFAALLTVFIPLGKYETREITYMQNGTEKNWKGARSHERDGKKWNG